MYLNRFVSSRYQSLACLIRPGISRFRLIVCQVQGVLELWRITLDQFLLSLGGGRPARLLAMNMF